MADERSVELMARWRQGDQEAASGLFRRYADRLIALARRRLPARLAQRVDAEDVVQSVYRSFFEAAREGRFELQRGGDLWRLLVAITLHKLHHQIRRCTAGRRSIDRELSLEDCEEREGLPSQALAQGPSPVEALAVAEVVEQIMSQLAPLERRMFELRLQGYDLYEIAALTDRCQRTVRRVLDRVKQQLRAWQVA
jgi:RNA polymerase sigma-70 factor (ECF subfamily)